jgi:hypothetical protein
VHKIASDAFCAKPLGHYRGRRRGEEEEGRNRKQSRSVVISNEINCQQQHI